MHAIYTICMISDNDFPEFAKTCIDNFIGLISWDDDNRAKALYSITIPNKADQDTAKTKQKLNSLKKKEKLLAFFSAPRNKILAKINPDFKRYIEPLCGDREMRFKDYLNMFPEYFGEEPNAAKFTNIGDIYFYESYSDTPVRAEYYLGLLYRELFAELDYKKPEAKPEPDKSAVISFATQSEEAFDYVNSLETIENIKGKTIQGKLIAENWGLEKDFLFASVAVSSYSSLHSNDANRLKEALTRWLNNVDYPSAQSLLKTLSPTNDSFCIRPYYKKAVVSIISSLEAGKWYSADDIYSYYKHTSAPVIATTYCDDDWDKFIKASFYSFIEENETRTGYLDYSDELVGKPIISGIMYILSFFGVLDITEKEPKIRIHKSARKDIPYSPCDALDMVSLTPFGRWLLDLDSEKPNVEKTVFSDPVLDKNLLIITYKGTGIKIRSFLSSISDPVGDVRFRVSLKSFTREAATESAAEKLIKEFCTFFPDPPSNWKDFLESVKKSYYILPQKSTGRLLEIQNMEAVKELFKIPAIRSLALMTESNYVFVLEENIKKFVSLIEKEGYHDAIAAPVEDPAKLAVKNYKEQHPAARGRRRSYW